MQKIPIKNLFYILCYAWGLAEQKDKIKVDAESCTTYEDLFAKLLTIGCSILLRRGLSKDYLPVTEDVKGVKGKMLYTDTLRKQVRTRTTTVCTYDDYTENILINQIIYSTIHKLLSIKTIEKENHKALARIFDYFPQVDIIDLDEAVFRNVVINRENRFYALLIHLCQIISERLVPSKNEKGKYTFVDFDDERMNGIFENFLFNFYRYNYGETYLVKREILNFDFEELEDSSDDVLPEMRTDVSLINKHGGRKIILDAKYYSKTLESRFYNSKGKISRTNISQVLSYIDSTKNAVADSVGILVYPKVSEDVNAAWKYKTTHIVKVCTVDLNKNWQDIELRLHDVITKDIA